MVSQNLPTTTIQPRHLLVWLTKFLTFLRVKRRHLEELERQRLPASLANKQQVAKFRVNEAINFVQTSLTCDQLVDINIGQCDCVILENEEEPIDELVGRICVRLLALCPLRLVVKASHSQTCHQLVNCLIELLHDSGLTEEHIQLMTIDDLGSKDGDLFTTPHVRARSGICNEQTNEPLQSISVAVCFDGCDARLATEAILKGYLRELPSKCNLLVLVEESTFYQFTIYWHRAYEQLAPRQPHHRLSQHHMDEQIQVDLDCLEISLASRMSGKCINVIQFRSIEAFCCLMERLRYVSHCQVWTGGQSLLMARELCLNQLQLQQQCQQFWINHLPTSLAATRLQLELYGFYKESLRSHMDAIYSMVATTYKSQLVHLRERQKNSMKFMRVHERAQANNFAYFSLINKIKSMKPSEASVAESMVRMRQFQRNFLHFIDELPDEYRMESQLYPVGLAILVVRDKSCIKSKSVLVEFIFKNLILGNGVLLVGPSNLLGVRFPQNLIENFNLPFVMVDLVVSDLSNRLEVSHLDDNGNFLKTPTGPTELHFGQLVLDSAGCRREKVEYCSPNGKCSKVKCPESAYAIELKPPCELTSELVETLVVALGSKQRSILYPVNVSQQLEEGIGFEDT